MLVKCPELDQTQTYTEVKKKKDRQNLKVHMNYFNLTGVDIKIIQGLYLFRRGMVLQIKMENMRKGDQPGARERGTELTSARSSRSLRRKHAPGVEKTKRGTDDDTRRQNKEEEREVQII